MTDPRLPRSIISAIPDAPPDPVTFANQNVRLPSSAISERFDVSITPWLREPLLAAADPLTRMVTFVKPIQCGGSTVGEIMTAYWILHGRGLMLYNWENGEKAEARWKERIDPMLHACAPVEERRLRLKRFADNDCDIRFGNFQLTVQGVFNPRNLDSATARFLINEEIHSWKPGHLVKSFGRTTMVWNHHILNISNASAKDDQLDQCYQTSTMRPWEVQCPGCKGWHVMRTRWDEKKPELGGLRYDADGARLGGGRYNYRKLARTIRFQMPCGYEVRDDPHERRRLSIGGRYKPPTNEGATAYHEGFTLEAVAVDRIPWLMLIQEKHAALRARRLGDLEPWRRYITERECGFFSPDDMPLTGALTIRAESKKDRAGLPNRLHRFFALDYQHGFAREGELPHWWLVIRDVDEAGNSLLVWEGKCESDADVIGVLRDHEVHPHCGVADSGHDAPKVYAFALSTGVNVIKGGGSPFYYHRDEAGGKSTRRIYSEPKALHAMLNKRPMYDYVPDGKGGYAPDHREPMFWLYSKFGIADRLHWLRNAEGIRHEVPSDVSDEYRAHQEAWERTERILPATGESVGAWKQIRKADHLLICERYIAMLVEMAGRIGDQQPPMASAQPEESADA